MPPIFLHLHLLLLLLLSCLTQRALVVSQAEVSDPSSRITVVGVVYCDTCSINTFSRQSYFLQGVEVHVSCRFKASEPKTAEEVNISVNRTTNRSGVYKVEIPHVDGVDCVDGIAIASQCQASLIRTTNRLCSIPVFKTSTNEISVKSKQDKLCIYSLSALSYKPGRRNSTLCGKRRSRSRAEAEKKKMDKSLRDSKFFWPYSLPYWFPWPYASLPPLPTLPPLPSLPFPPVPFTNPQAASGGLPPPPPLPAFDWRDPRTWIPYLPRFPSGNKTQNHEP